MRSAVSPIDTRQYMDVCGRASLLL
jgi:hypothetical protein